MMIKHMTTKMQIEIDKGDQLGTGVFVVIVLKVLDVVVVGSYDVLVVVIVTVLQVLDVVVGS